MGPGLAAVQVLHQVVKAEVEDPLRLALPATAAAAVALGQVSAVGPAQVQAMAPAQV